MAKITLYDPYKGKFTDGMVSWWESHGHEVRKDTYYDPELVEWADVVYFFTCDNNILSATNPSQALRDEWLVERRKTIPWDLHEFDLSKKKIIVHPVDIEVWSGHHAHENMWDVVDEVIFPTPHIQRLMMADSRPQQGNFNQHVIPFGVDLDKWTFSEHKKGYNIGILSELWESKGVDLVLQIALKLKRIDPRYNIEWRGKQQMYHWGKAYFDDFIKRNDLPITYSSEFIEDLNNWWEDKDYVLHCSAKETYSYAVAESMAKGIKPVFHHYYGAEETWPNLTWDSIDEAVGLITEDSYDSKLYRQYLLDNHLDLESMMTKIEGVING